jgi:hypothetical protein
MQAQLKDSIHFYPTIGTTPASVNLLAVRRKGIMVFPYYHTFIPRGEMFSWSIPAGAGIQSFQKLLDPRFRGG